MANLIGLLDLGRSALHNHQKSVQVTGHNIANVNTPGYTRQRVNLAASVPVAGAPGQVGMGVTATDIERIYDRYLQGQINAGTQDLGRWEAQQDALAKAEIILDETSGYGLGQVMGDFWTAWQELSNNPDGYAERVALLTKSGFMTDTFNQMAGDLERLRADLDVSIAGTVDEINRIAAQIADLNRKVGDVESGGQNANDYRDQRDLLLKELAELIDFDSFENDDGQVTVLVGDGRPLVDSPYSWQLATQQNAGGHLDVMWRDRDGNLSDMSAAIDGGRLNGWLTARDTTIADYAGRLDTLADRLMTAVNNTHQIGFDLNGTGGQAFFTGSSAADMTLNAAVSADTDLIAAAATAAGVPGDNGNAVAMAGLQHAALMNGGTASFDDYYASLIGDVGQAVRQADDNHRHQTALTDSLAEYRDSISGVSLDEEMMNLIKFQHAYDAAAKMVTTVDELIDTVMGMVR